MTAEPPATGDGGRVAAPTAEASDDAAARPDATRPGRPAVLIVAEDGQPGGIGRYCLDLADRLPALRRAYGVGR